MDRRYFDDHGRPWFRPGDEVTRDGTDIHVVVDTNEHDGYPPDGMTVRCTKEPLGYLHDDGTRGEPWTKIGEEEFNTCSRYDFVDPAIEALRPAPEPFVMPEDPGDNPTLTAALLRAGQMRSMEMAEFRARVMGKVVTDYIIALGLASNEQEAGKVRIVDVLQAERGRTTA